MENAWIDEAIKQGTWYVAEADTWKGKIRFKLRVHSFAQMPDESIPEDVRSEVEGVIWLLGIEVVNLDTQPISPPSVREVLLVIDHDGCHFECISTGLDKDKASGVHRFSGWSDAQISPKIPVKGSVPYALPHDPATYRVGVKDGKVSQA